MSSFGKSSKSKTTPYAPAAPAINAGLSAAQGVFNTQQPILQENAQLAQDGYKQIASKAFGANPFVSQAQGAAGAINSGAFIGANPGAGTYRDLMTANDPSMGILKSLSQGSTSPGKYDDIGTNNPALATLSGMTNKTNPAAPTLSGMTDQNNPALAMFKEMTKQNVNGQTTDLYGRMTSKDYSTANPFVDAIAKQGEDAALKAVNQRFAASGMGEGMSTPYADLASRNVADAGNAIRYQNYNDAENRALTAGGQSDAQYSAARERELAAANSYGSTYGADRDRALSAAEKYGLLTGNDMDRNLSAAQSLGTLTNQGDTLRLNAQQAKDGAFQSDRSSQLAAAQSLGSQNTANNTTRLNAANMGDNQQSSQIDQLLKSLSMTGDLSAADYAGVNPALSLLQASNNSPYSGLGNYADIINALSGNLTTKKTTDNPSTMDKIGKTIDVGTSIASLFSDRRLKTDITRVGATDDGLGVYTYRYAWGGPVQMGVMADEVAQIRPEALGPVVEGFATVNYGAL